MNTPQQVDFRAPEASGAAPASDCRLRGVSVSRLSQKAPADAARDATLLVQVNDAEYRALAHRAHLSGCTVEQLVSRSIHNLLREE